MKKIVLGLFTTILFVSCQSKVTSESLKSLKGYWEIERVVFKEGPDKAYTANENFDYFELKGQQGFRKKVKPNLDGTFETNDISEKFKINDKDGRFFIQFTTDYDQWTEEIVVLNEKELVLKNKEDKEYHYKKAQPINVLTHEKAAQ